MSKSITLSAMLWFAFNFLSMLSLAGAELTQQHLLNKKTAVSVRTSSVLTFAFEWLFSIPVVFLLYSKHDIFGHFTSWLIVRILAVTLLASVGMQFYLRSYLVKNISYSNIFGTISIPIATILGIIVFGEGVHPLKFIGIALILVALIALNYRNAHLERNHAFSLFSGMIFGFAYVLDKANLQQLAPGVYIFWSFLFVAVFGFLLGPKDVILSVKGRTLNFLWPIVLSAMGYFLYNFLTFSAYRLGGSVGAVDAVNSTAVYIIIAFEFIVMRNRHSLRRKLLTASIAYIGIILLGLFGR